MTTIIIDDCKIQNLTTSAIVKNNPDLNYLGSYTNAKKGLKEVNRLKPDVLILDVEMPNLNGFDVLEKLEHDCQVIMYSTREEFAFKANQNNQVNDFITKPVQMPRFKKSISKVISNTILKNYNENLSNLSLERRDLVIAS